MTNAIGKVRCLIIRDYVCSVCWGHLDLFNEHVECAKYGTEHEGYVTKHYAENRRQDDAGDFIDARHTLRAAGIIENPHEGKTADQLLDELGFGG